MSKSERIDRAQDIILQTTCVEYIMDCFCTPDYIEVVGNAGGDTLRYRVYDNGDVYER